MKKRFSYILTLVFSFMLSTNVVLAAKSFDSKVKVKACGFSKMPANLPAFTSGLYNLIKILVPVILIIMVMVDLISGVMADSEDGAKKSKKKIITRFIAAIVVFFVMSITQVIFKAVAKEDANGMSECINCILNKKCTISGIDLDIEFGKKTEETDDKESSSNKTQSSGSLISIVDDVTLITANIISNNFDKICTGLGYTWNANSKKCYDKNGNEVLNETTKEKTTKATYAGPDSSWYDDMVKKWKSSINDNSSKTKSNSVSSAKGSQIVEYAKKYVGNSYVWGGTWNGEDPYTGTDCSGFTQGVYRHFGYNLPRTAAGQADASIGKEVPYGLDSLQPGDLLFFYNSERGTIGHVVMYAGNGQVVHAAGNKEGIKIGNYYTGGLVKARRIID